MSEPEIKQSFLDQIADVENVKQSETMRATATENTDSFFKKIAVDETALQNQPRPNARTIQRKTRLSKVEDEKFLARVKRSQKSQSDFIREAILNGKIHSLMLPPNAEAACNSIVYQGTEMKKIAGLLIQSLMINRQLCQLDHQQIDRVNQLIDMLKEKGDEIIRTGDELYGYLQAYRRP